MSIAFVVSRWLLGGQGTRGESPCNVYFSCVCAVSVFLHILGRSSAQKPKKTVLQVFRDET